VTGGTIQWYPGHMARAMRRLAADVKIVDLVIEVIDARVPGSGANPALDKVAANKARLRVLTRDDLADPEQTERWLERLRATRPTIAFASKEPSGPARLRAAVTAAGAGSRSSRALVLGIPNAGKSTVINALAGRKVARTEDRAGVTRGVQWFRLENGLEVMDTAGILVPKIETDEAQWRLALVGAVPRARFDPEEVIARFHRWAEGTATANAVPELETFAQSRGFIRRGNVSDVHNAALAYIKEFGEGRFGRLTLEAPPP